MFCVYAVELDIFVWAVIFSLLCNTVPGFHSGRKQNIYASCAKHTVQIALKPKISIINIIIPNGIILTKKIKICPSGKELNPATGRCRNKCPSNKERNSKGNCVVKK